VTTDDSAAHYPAPRTYWIIAFILAAVTAIEVGIAYVEGLSGWVAPLLIILGAIKFGIVVAFFMHLKFEKPLMKSLFLIGVFGAIILFVVVLATFRVL
jgi:cytochrome c oxidase subunit 4